MEFPRAAFFTRADLAKIGVTDHEIKRARRRGSIVPLGRGAYADAAAYKKMTVEQRHVMAARAIAEACDNPTVSHESAAMAHGLDMWNPDLSRVHLSVDAARGGRKTKDLHVHTSRLPDKDVTVVDGLTVTTVTRTAVDLARSLPFEAAVCVVDSALHYRKTTKPELVAALDACAGLTGCGAARRVIEFADGKSESVGESRSRVYLQRYGFPRPELQVTLRHPKSTFTVRPDFLFEGVILEFDGRIKYTDENAYFDEKLRGDELMDLGWILVRWTWDDLSSDAGAHKLQRGFDRAAELPGPLTARVV